MKKLLNIVIKDTYYLHKSFIHKVLQLSEEIQLVLPQYMFERFCIFENKKYARCFKDCK